MEKEEYLEKLKSVEDCIDTALNELRTAEGDLVCDQNNESLFEYLKMIREALEMVEELDGALTNEIDELEDD